MRAGLARWLRRFGVPLAVLLLTLAFAAAIAGSWMGSQEPSDDVRAFKQELLLWAGLAVGGMLAALAYLLGNARERAQVLAERMTSAFRESEQRWAFALEGSGDGLWDWQIIQGTVTTSERAKLIMGWQGQADVEPSIAELQSRMHPEDRERALAELQRCLDGSNAHLVAEFRVKHASGAHEWNWVLARGTVVERDRRERALRMIGTVSDINVRRRSEERVRFMALHDPLTELANRAHFDERLHFALAHARRYNEPIGLILLDLDRFKAVNDVHGHAVGDQLLQTVARRLKACVRETDTAGRIGGDEFVVLLTGPLTRESAQRVSEKIYAQIAQPMDLGGLRLEITCSLGLALYPDDGADEKALAKSADDAMYRNKRAGRQLFGEVRKSGFTEP